MSDSKIVDVVGDKCIGHISLKPKLTLTNSAAGAIAHAIHRTVGLHLSVAQEAVPAQL